MICVDIQSHSHLVITPQTPIGGNTAQSFGKQYRSAAVQDAEGLYGTVIHGHAPAQVVITYVGEFNSQRSDGRIFGVLSHLLQSGIACPDSHFKQSRFD
jgi:hypothetical protein